MLGQIALFQHSELGNLDVQIHFLFDHGVAAGQRLNFSIGQRLLVHILSRAHRAFAGHNLGDKFLLALHQLIEVGVEGSLGDIAVNIHLTIFIALANDAPLPLLKVSRSFFADSSYMLSFSVLCSCVCSRLISPSVSSWHKQDNTLMHQSPGHIQRRTPYNF